MSAAAGVYLAGAGLALGLGLTRRRGRASWPALVVVVLLWPLVALLVAGALVGKRSPGG